MPDSSRIWHKCRPLKYPKHSWTFLIHFIITASSQYGKRLYAIPTDIDRNGILSRNRLILLLSIFKP